MGYLARLVAYLGKLIEAVVPGGPGLPVVDIAVLVLLVIGAPWPVLATAAVLLLAPAVIGVLVPASS